jgi:glycine/D-amino acid oxidase-like deaminating enzyme
MMTQDYDVVVIGAGIVGAACASEFARDGMKVAIVERDVIGGGATAAGMGHVVVMDDSPAQLALTRFSQAIWTELSPDLPRKIEHDHSGTLWIAADEEEMEEVHRKNALYATAGVATQVLNGSALAEAEPWLCQPLPGALLVPSDSVLYAPAAAAFMVARAQQTGASLLSGKTVTAVGQGELRLDSDERLRSNRIVIANGTAAPELCPGLLLKKRKGHLAITDRYPGKIKHQLVELGYLKSAHSLTTDSVAFNVQPRMTGQLLIGSSRQYDVDERSIDQPILSQMLERACRYLPALRAVSVIRAWTGFRAATPDKLPLIGPTADPTLFLATGHEGLGITTSVATARLLSDYFAGRESQIPLAPYLPSRFLSETIAHA